MHDPPPSSRLRQRGLYSQYKAISQYYLIGKTIGEGTFGKVKKGVHRLTRVKVAIKILEKSRIVDVDDVERVSREIHILKHLKHPNIINLYEVIDTKRFVFLIMEYASGGELFDFIVKHNRVDEEAAAVFFHQIINGMEYCHNSNVIHRDLKPENLLLDAQSNVKIVDFGLGNIQNSSSGLLSTACGSPCYAPPEMIQGKPYRGSQSDIWSTGVILYALVCGYLPFEDPNTSALYKKICRGQYECPDFISPAVRDLISRILNTDPDRRLTVEEIRLHPWYCLAGVVVQREHWADIHQVRTGVVRHGPGSDDRARQARLRRRPAVRRRDQRDARDALRHQRRRRQRAAPAPRPQPRHVPAAAVPVPARAATRTAWRASARLGDAATVHPRTSAATVRRYHVPSAHLLQATCAGRRHGSRHAARKRRVAGAGIAGSCLVEEGPGAAADERRPHGDGVRDDADEGERTSHAGPAVNSEAHHDSYGRVVSNVAGCKDLRASKSVPTWKRNWSPNGAITDGDLRDGSGTEKRTYCRTDGVLPDSAGDRAPERVRSGATRDGHQEGRQRIPVVVQQQGAQQYGPSAFRVDGRRLASMSNTVQRRTIRQVG